MTLTRLFQATKKRTGPLRARFEPPRRRDTRRRGLEPVAAGREETQKRVERTSPSSVRARRVRGMARGACVCVWVFIERMRFYICS